MATWTTLPDAALEPGKPIRSIDGLALRDNPVAITEGAAGAPKMQTNGITDSAVTTAKLAANEQMTTANVLNATAGASVGAVGTYAFAGLNSGSIATGGTVAGSSLQFANVNPTISGALSGTWRCMGFTDSFNLASRITLWLRIS